jgi:hypothetical protein
VKNELEAGSQRTGLLVDGLEGTPYVVATLSHDPAGKIGATVPFLPDGSPQFVSAREWFDLRGSRLPPNLLFEDERGAVSLYGASTHFSSIGTGISVGKFTAENIIFARTVNALEDELKVQAFRSKIDGLTEWLGGRAISVESQSDTEGRLTRVNVSAQSPDDIEWMQGEARMTLAVHWNWSGQRELKIEEYALLHSEFVGYKGTPEEHLTQHRVVRALLTILFGQAVYYREHWVKDEQFPLRMLNGRVADVPWQRAYHQRTLEEHHKPAPPKPRTSQVIARFDQIGTAGLESWANIYTHWRRPIDVLVALLERQGGFIEERVLSASMAIESAGHLIGPIDGEPAYLGRNVPFANQVFRCLRTIDFDVTAIAASHADLAAAAASVYRRIKHPEHEMPDSLHSWLMSQVLTLVARLIIVKQVTAAEDLVEPFLNSASSALAEVFENNGQFVGTRGVFETRPPA